MSQQPCEVLVVGAGPSGLTTAHELLRRGIAVRVVDAAAGPAPTSRALATHARTLEIYDQMGLLSTLLPQGRRIRKFTVHQNGRRLAALRADYSELPTRFPMTVMVDQAITEKVLRDAVAALGTRVEWGVRLDSFEQDADGITAELAHADGRREQLRTPWLVGCDGGHSLVRKLLGLRLIGESSETWLIADAVMDADLDDASLHWLRTAEGAMMAVPFPEPGKWRLLDTAEAVYDGDAKAVGERFSRKLTRALGSHVTVQEPSWVSVFTIQQRMINEMRAGRCFVVGDAAHVHSPASGQGMNTGIQDAYNLAWKLAAVVRGRAADALLDSYPAERVPVGAALLGSTNRATQLIQLRSTVAALILPVMFGVVRMAPPLQRKISRKIMRAMSALDLSYAGSALSQAPDASAAASPAAASDEGPQVGGRVSRLLESEAEEPGFAALVAELRDPRWTLFARVDGDGDRDLWARLDQRQRTWLSVRTVGAPGVKADGPNPLPDRPALSRRLGLTAPGRWLLVRPDGYASAQGDGRDPAALTAALALATAGLLTDPLGDPATGSTSDDRSNDAWTSDSTTARS